MVTGGQDPWTPGYNIYASEMQCYIHFVLNCCSPSFELNPVESNIFHKLNSIAVASPRLTPTVIKK